MIEQVEIRGLWWLPDKEDNKVAGILNFVPAENLTLELIGSFYNDLFDLFKTTNNAIDVLWGESSKGKPITLINCFQSFSYHSDCSFPLISLSVNFVIIGKHLHSLEEACVDKIIIRYDELSHWYSPSIVKYSFREQSWDQITNSNDEEKIISFSKDNLSLSLKPQALLNIKGRNTQITVDIETNLVVKSTELLSVRHALDINRSFEQFLSVATLSRVQCKQIFLQCFNSKTSLEVLHNTFREEYCPIINREHYLFRYDDIKDEFESIMINWYSNEEEIYPIRSHLIASLESTRVFNSANFLSVVQALEGYYSRFKKNRQSLTSILNDLFNDFNYVNKIRGEEAHIGIIVNSRNYFSHLNPPDNRLVVDGKNLYEHYIKLRILLLCCILRFMGFEDNKIQQIIDNCQNNICRVDK